MFVSSRLLFLLIFISLIINANENSFAQCTTVISNFPFQEGFENNNGGFSRSSTIHWEWGSIQPGSKPVITSAAVGQKCWVVGGLAGSVYTSGNSSLQTPCFNLSGMTDPEISFRIFWETEKNYDGVNLEYSPDQGNSWFILGSENSDANCAGVNWYNNSSVRFLGNKPGWSGSISAGSGGNCQTGNGSGQWLTARHKLTDIAGLTAVTFRFNFGAGTICNNYDGFAIDEFEIHESPVAAGTIQFQCTGNQSVSFSNTPQLCQTSLNWNFGDPGSGSQNTSTSSNPVHNFSAPGNYLITQTIQLSNGTTLTSDTTITVLGASIQLIQPISCSGGQNGIIQAIGSGTQSALNYQWSNPPGLQSAALQNLSSGNYTVTISATDACYATASFVLQTPPPLQTSLVINNESCHQQNGSITASVTGGTGPYTYAWSNGLITQNITGLSAGDFTLNVTDANGCASSPGVRQLLNVDYPVNVDLGNDTVICPGQTLLLRPGNYAAYLWQDQSVAPTFSVRNTGTYFVEVSNEKGCRGADTIQVQVQCDEIYFPQGFTPDHDGLNETFGVIGGIGEITQYELSIYNRWGQRVFYTTDPYKKWDGGFRGKPMGLESYIWICRFKKNGSALQFRKGFVTAIH